MFKKSVKKVPYFECSPNGSGQPQAPECAEREIVSYPTWQFPEAELEALGDNVWKQLFEVQLNAFVVRNPETEVVWIDDNSLSYFEKFKLIPGAYNQGRLSGTKSIEELALFTGCITALEKDALNQSDENSEESTSDLDG